MEDTKSLWRYLQEKFQESLSKVSYDTWILSAKAINLTDKSIIIEVPSPLHKEYWENNLTTRTLEFLYEYYGRELSPVFVTADEQQKTDQSNTLYSFK